jgi:nucleoside-diphosphate-sugar epimerase
MRAIVTGGAGFIGSHVVDVLQANGDRVLVVDNMSRGCMPNLADALSRGARLVRADGQPVARWCLRGASVRRGLGVRI